MNVALAILPIAITILCGCLLVQCKMVPRAQWAGIELLAYRLLIPAILISAISGAEIEFVAFGRLITVLLGSLTLAGCAMLGLRLFLNKSRLPNPALTTLFQTTTRWNGFIALAIVQLAVGDGGLAMVALIMAVMIPFINVANIVVLAAYGPANPSFVLIAKAVTTNPMVQGCVIGLCVNLSGIPLAEPIRQALDLVGRGAIGIEILAVGASIEPLRLFEGSGLLWLGVVSRLLFCPALFLLFAGMVGLSEMETFIGAIALGVPAASGGYIIARQMGGDAELYAEIVAWQTIVSMFVLPCYMLLLLA
ncbi:AEC family transporter [Ruegeria hyattellae]|uniref:AEC family transporter n=1 Tax=Ruegeria hyattellae TaxID=3233337 RepID=UPI00355B3C6B